MLTYDRYVQIRYLRTTEGLNSVQIGARLNLPERTVRNWWNLTEYPSPVEVEREHVTDLFAERVVRWLADHPKLSGTKVYQRLCRSGYTGSAATVRRYLAGIRPRPTRSFLTLNFAPGEAMQVDFGYCGYLRQGSKNIRLCVCAAVLCHSRLLYAEIIPGEKMEYTFSCLQNALQSFGGAPRKIIVDNFKGAVLHHGRHGEVRYNPHFLDFTSHYGMLPVACNPRSPQEKGRIEQGIGYIKGNFIAGNRFTSLEEARSALQGWLAEIANVRIHGTTRQRPVDLFEREEKAALLPLNAHRFDCSRVEKRLVDARCRVHCDGNQYSVPSRYAGLPVHLKITADTVYLYHDGKLIASHPRSCGSGDTVTDPRHGQLMLEERRTAARQNLRSDFLALGRDAAAMLQALEDRLENVDAQMRKIMLLTEIYGADAVKNALLSAVENQVYGADYVEYLIRLKSRPPENHSCLLHVPKGGDNLKVTLATPDLNAYDIQ